MKRLFSLVYVMLVVGSLTGCYAHQFQIRDLRISDQNGRLSLQESELLALRRRVDRLTMDSLVTQHRLSRTQRTVAEQHALLDQLLQATRQTMRDIRDLARAVIVLDERQQQHATPPSRRRASGPRT